MKKTNGQKKAARATLRLPEPLLVKVDELAERQERTRSWVIEKCVETCIREVESGSDPFHDPDRQPGQELIAA